MSEDAHRKIINEERLGDLHNGHAVTLVHYEDGHKRVYKPRSMQIDRAWASFCRWLREAGMPYSPYAVPVHYDSKGVYSEYIAHLPLPSPEAAPEYYRRCGALLCVCYLLGSKDMHCENLIAHGEYPVLVDAETLLNGEVLSFLETPVLSETPPVYPEKKNCLLLTSLLPHQTVWEGTLRDTGGFTGQPEAEPNLSRNIPFLPDGTPILARNYVPQIIQGFQAAYRWLSSHRDHLLQDSPYGQFAHCSLRILLRSTQVYTRLLHRLQQMDMQQSPELYEQQLGKLALAFTRYASAERLPQLMPIYHAEAAAIRRGDIPYFILHASSTALYDEKDQFLCPDYLAVSAFDRSLMILRHMSEQDCAQQSDIIRASFRAAYPKKEQADPPSSHALSPAETADAIGQLLMEKAFADTDGSPSWFVSCPASDGMGGVKICDHSLYSGRAGIALFLSALWKTRKNAAAKDMALRLSRSILRQTENSFARGTHLHMPLGWGSGLGGLMAALHDISQYLDEPALFPRHWLQHVSREWVAKDDTYDVLGGAAGLLLAMQHCRIRNESVCRMLADHLLSGRTTWQDIPLIFRPQRETQPLTGFGHGAAGIAAALWQAFETTGHIPYRTAAQSMLKYEKSCYDPRENNWPDYRNREGAPVYMHGWCAGAPGTGIGSIMMNMPCPKAEQWVMDHPLLPYDHLCCGNAGLIDFLVIVGQYRQASERAAALARRYPANPLPLYHGPCVINAGLFTGYAGIGFACLRAMYPQQIQSVLY